MRPGPLVAAIALVMPVCDSSVRLDTFDVGVVTSRATCVAALTDYTARPPATSERVVVLRARHGADAQRLDAIRTEAARRGATGILLGRPQDSARLPAAAPGETWATALLVTADSGLVHSACDSH